MVCAYRAAQISNFRTAAIQAQYEAQALQERPSYMSTLHLQWSQNGRVNSMWNPMNSHELCT